VTKALRGIVIHGRHSHVEGVTLRPPAFRLCLCCPRLVPLGGERKQCLKHIGRVSSSAYYELRLSKRDASANELYEVIRLMADQNGETA
jgi:predicted ester cyclase